MQNLPPLPEASRVFPSSSFGLGYGTSPPVPPEVAAISSFPSSVFSFFSLCFPFENDFFSWNLCGCDPFLYSRQRHLLSLSNFDVFSFPFAHRDFFSRVLNSSFFFSLCSSASLLSWRGGRRLFFFMLDIKRLFFFPTRCTGGHFFCARSSGSFFFFLCVIFFWRGSFLEPWKRGRVFLPASRILFFFP